MNKHMKAHSQRLNIKTTRLASLTAIFRRKKKVPRVAEVVPSVPGMRADSPNNRVHNTTPHELTFLHDDDEMDVDGNGGSECRSENENEGPLVDLDSEDEFESDEEGVDGGDGCGPGQGMLDFELKAAEAGASS